MTTDASPSPDFVDEFRKRLEDARARLVRVVATTDEELETLEGREPGGLPESAAVELATGTLSALEGRDRHELDEIDAAQARLEAGTFGVCESCGQPIPLSRLRAVPTTRYCVNCSARDEI